MEENNNDKQLIDLLNQLIQTQVQIAAIISTRFERQTTDNVKNKISQKQSNIYNEAQKLFVGFCFGCNRLLQLRPFLDRQFGRQRPR